MSRKPPIALVLTLFPSPAFRPLAFRATFTNLRLHLSPKPDLVSPRPQPTRSRFFPTSSAFVEGLFIAAYKYGLADISIELGDNSGSPFVVSPFAIEEKIVEYYRRHATSCAASGEARVPCRELYVLSPIDTGVAPRTKINIVLPHTQTETEATT